MHPNSASGGGGDNTLTDLKIMVIGDAGVGKTSLVSLLLGQPTNNTRPTKGCQIQVLVPFSLSLVLM